MENNLKKKKRKKIHLLFHSASGIYPLKADCAGPEEDPVTLSKAGIGYLLF